MKHTPQNWTIQSEQTVEYTVELVRDVLDPANPALLGGETGVRRLIVTDEVIDRLYGAKIRAFAEANLSEYEILVLSDGEQNKRWASVELVLQAIERFKLDRRREPVIAIGGGVVTDIVGFACSIYRRNTPFIRVPTTLMGIVDAGVGIKTGVNFEQGKNKIGTYFPANHNFLDLSFLETLPVRHLSNGLSEILKIALIKDARLFELLADHSAELLSSKFQTRAPFEAEIIERAITGMLEELEPNLWEAKLERLVDYGHSFSPTIEMHALPELLHGEAVCLDMAFTTAIGVHRGLVEGEQAARVLEVMQEMNLPITNPIMKAGLLAKALADTTRHRNGKQRLPLPVGIGSATFVNDLTETDILAALNILTAVEALNSDDRVSAIARGQKAFTGEARLA